MNTDLTQVLGLLRLARALKSVRRQGWVDRGVEDPESVADHSWSVALMAWLLAADRPDLDRQRVLLLGLVHDLPEAIAGDETPFDMHRDHTGAIDPQLFDNPPTYPQEARQRKQQREAAALDEMLTGLPENIVEDVRSAWFEYDLAQSAEARFVKQVDKLETAMQAIDYRHLQPDLVIESFLLGAARDIDDELLSALLQAETEQS